MTKAQSKGRWHPSRKSQQQKMAQLREWDKHFATKIATPDLEPLDMSKGNWSL